MVKQVNSYGFNKITLKEIKEITGKSLLNGVEPNIFNMIIYKAHKNINNDNMLSYFDYENKSVIDLFRFKMPKYAVIEVRRILKNCLLKDSKYKYLKSIYDINTCGNIVILYCKDLDTCTNRRLVFNIVDRYNISVYIE